MIDDQFKDLTGLTWNQAVTRTNALFFEADALNERAYSLLRRDTLSPQLWADFSATRKEADERYARARLEWLRIKRVLSSVERATHGLQI